VAQLCQYIDKFQALNTKVISMALERRFRSREESPFGDKLLSAIRGQFGGHAVKKE
jgi:6-phosphogluconate dehydrogenase